MGAERFKYFIEGENPKKCFEKLVQQSIISRYCESYDGTIAICEFGKCTLQFDKYLNSNEEKALKYIEDNEDISIDIANYIDLGIVEYELVNIYMINEDNIEENGIRYYILKREGFNFSNIVEFEYTLNEANNKAMELKINNPNEDFIVCKNNSVCTKFGVEKIKYKNKPKLNLKENQKLLEIHKYLFYGWARY